MTGRARPHLASALVYGALFAGLFLGGLGAGYVYRHEPARDTLEVQIAAEGGAAGVRTVTGTVASAEGGRLTLTTAGGPLSIVLPAGAPVDELLRAPEGLSDGTRVNVGLLSTRYGLVLTGLVAVEGAR